MKNHTLQPPKHQPRHVFSPKMTPSMGKNMHFREWTILEMRNNYATALQRMESSICVWSDLKHEHFQRYSSPTPSVKTRIIREPSKPKEIKLKEIKLTMTTWPRK
ncbi:hypothetical protein I7I48_06325 [Histoplasma ohiense]|nr:hypothetical protein I7I48_06325 [Histoplasma ohiense (nom. inval.)]